MQGATEMQFPSHLCSLLATSTWHGLVLPPITPPIQTVTTSPAELFPSTTSECNALHSVPLAPTLQVVHFLMT